MSRKEVEITCSSKGLREILVDGEALDCSAIMGKEMPDWFRPARDGSGWRGLIPEIQSFLPDPEEVELSFSFNGSPEDQRRFFKCLEEIDLERRYAEAGRLPDKEAFLIVRELAEQGYVPAQDYLGICYAKGRGVEADIQKALHWYKKSAEQGNARAQINLGNCYLNGEGVEEDDEEAVKWFLKSAEQGHPVGQYNLSQCYLNGLGVVKDEAQAVGWFRAAAERGYAPAQRELGKCYFRGIGLPKDAKTANEWFMQAAFQGDAEAKHQLGVNFLDGIGGIDRDVSIAIKMFREAAEQGWSPAKNSLGVCYETGDGVEQNAVLAFQYYQDAAESGSSNAQRNLGRCYELGIGTVRDIDEAVKWYERAVEQGDIRAYVYLSNYYMFRREKGKSGMVQPDYDEAYRLLRIAVEYDGHPIVHHLYAMSIYAKETKPEFKIDHAEGALLVPVVDYPSFPSINTNKGLEIVRAMEFLEETALGQEMRDHLEFAAANGYEPSRLCLLALKNRPIPM